MKTKKRSDKQKNLRAYKRNTVYNVYQDNSIAIRAQDWSFDTIYQRLGIKIEPKKLYRAPVPKKPKKSNITKKMIQESKYNQVFEITHNKERARVASDLTYKDIEKLYGFKPTPIKRPATLKQKSYLNFLQHMANGHKIDNAFKNRFKRSIPPVIAVKPTGMPDDLFEKWDLGNRDHDWRVWSSSKNSIDFPGWIKEKVYQLNRQNGMDADARFGYAVLNFMYVQGWDEESALDYIIPDPDSEFEYRYTGLVRTA